MERSVRAILRAETGQYEAGMARAAQATERVGQAAQGSARQTQQATQQQTSASRTFSQRLTESARQNEQAWTSVGTAMLGIGVAGAGLLAVVGKTGIEYNSLRQVATQGLTAITGSTEEAAAQMQRLDDYGQNSWLMRDTLIEAQRQMTGFGISTEKVVPYMDALAEGVAASGGNNQDFLELAQVMGQIQGQSKITAEELRRFGLRGIDAATMIGDAMGMTGGEIREQITSGALDAETALDALAQGMMMNFEGSSDLVRQTFRGAVDDVIAAFRDLSAGAMSMFVNPEGGGLFVGLMNNVADFLRSLESLPDPLLNAAIAIGGLTTAAALAGGAFLTFFPRALRLADSLGELGLITPRVGEALRTMGPRIMRVGRYATGAVVGIVALGNAAQGLQEHFSGAALGVNELEQAMRQGDFDSAFSHLTGSYDSLQEAWDRLTGEGAIDQLDRWMSAINQGLGGHLPDDIQGATEVFEGMSEVLAGLVNDGNPDLAAEMFDNMAESLGLTADQHEILMSLLPGYSDALAGVANASEDAAEGSGSLVDGLEDIDPAAMEAAAAMEALSDALSETSVGFVDALGAWDAVIEKNAELAQSSAEASGDADAAWEDFYDGHSVSISDYLDELQRQVDAQTEWQANMTTLAGRVSDETLEHLARLGPEGAPLVAALVDASDEEIDRFEDLMAQGSQDAGEAFATSLIEAIPLIREAMGNMSDEGIAEMTERLRNGETTIADEIAAWDTEGIIDIPVDIDTEGATEDFNTMTEGMDMTNVMPTLDLDPGPATLVFNAETHTWETTTTPTNLDLNPDDAIQVFNAETGLWEMTTTDTLLDLNPSDAVRVFDRETNSWYQTTTDTALGLNSSLANQGFSGVTKLWGNSLTNTRLGLNPSSAQGTFGSTTGGWANNTTYTNLGANTASARATVSGFAAWVRGLRPTVTVTAKTLGPSLKGALATGGPVHGVGSETSDSNLYALSVNEHVLSAREVRGLGGHGAVEQMRAMARAGAGLRAALDGGVRGFADGGTPAYRYMPQPPPPPVASAQAAGPAVATLDPEDRALLRAVVSRPVEVRMGRRVLAEATAVAGEYGRSRGQGRG